MKKFRFRLQPVLDLRELEEDQKKRVVGRLVQDISEQQQAALTLAAQMRDEGRKLREQLERGKVDLEWTGHYFRYVQSMHQAINQRIAAVAQIQKKLTGARQDLAEAAKKTKILGKLKEHQKRRYDLALRRMETREMDEIGTNGYLRNRAEGTRPANDRGPKTALRATT
jgi:flagellar protein FliJ